MCLICFMTIVQIIGARLHKETLRTVMSAPLRFFTTTDSGIMTNIFSQDLTLIDGQIPGSLVNFAIYMISCLRMAAVVAGSSPFLVITYPFFAIILTHFMDTIKGITTFRAFGWIQDSINVNKGLVDDSQRPVYPFAMLQRWLSFTLQFVIAGLAFVVVTLATQLPANAAFTGASLATVLLFGENLLYRVQPYAVLETSIPAVSRLKSFRKKVPAESQEGVSVTIPVAWPTTGVIKINGVSASYV
ncbi:ABC transporter [Metarhizium guizhouense ARSEF 977]|uniref:ABC transporter n=1 Tax=Metarhizium guizhouense (strain ARSEF 977) TaxID=1276136 RepID=A0A0B4GZ54_METGA|nr:ABC transporter [Metarhizium guizhouense ARSEF 977]